MTSTHSAPRTASWAQWLFAIICAAISVLAAINAHTQYTEVAAGRDAEQCSATDSTTTGCLDVVPARVTDTRRESGRYSYGNEWFIAPDDASDYEASWYELADSDDDLTAAQQRAADGAPVTAWYYNGEPTAVRSGNETIYLQGWAPGDETTLYWVSLAAGGLAALYPMMLYTRRPHVRGRTRGRRAYAAALAMTPLGLTFGAVASTAGDTLGTQLLAAVICWATWVALFAAASQIRFQADPT